MPDFPFISTEPRWPGEIDPEGGVTGGQLVFGPGRTGATGAQGPPGKDANPLLSILLSALQMTQAKKLANKQQPIDVMQLMQMLMRPQGQKPKGFF